MHLVPGRRREAKGDGGGGGTSRGEDIRGALGLTGGGGGGFLAPWREVPSPCLPRVLPCCPRLAVLLLGPVAPTGASRAVVVPPASSSQRLSISAMRSAKVRGRQSSLISAVRASLRLRSAAGVRLSEEEAGATRRRLVSRVRSPSEVELLRSLFMTNLTDASRR